MGGGSSGTQVDQRSWQGEKRSIKPAYDFNVAQYDKYRDQNPLLSRATSGAEGFWDKFFNPNNASWTQFLGAGSPLQQGLTGIMSTIAGGGYSPEMARQGQQVARTQAAATGTTKDNSAVVNEYQQTENARNAALNTATGQASGLQGLMSGAQSLATGGINQLLGVGNAAVSQAGQVFNPILSYLSNLFSGNQQAQIANAQISAQQGASSKAGTSSAVGGGLAAVGSIAAAAL